MQQWLLIKQRPSESFEIDTWMLGERYFLFPNIVNVMDASGTLPHMYENPISIKVNCSLWRWEMDGDRVPVSVP